MSEWISKARIGVFGEQHERPLTPPLLKSFISTMSHVANVKIKAKSLAALNKLARLSEYVECTIEAVQSQGIDEPTWINPGAVKLSSIDAASGVRFEMSLPTTCVHCTTKIVVQLQNLVLALSCIWYDDNTALELHWDRMGKSGAMVRVCSKTEKGKMYAAVIAPQEI